MARRDVRQSSGRRLVQSTALVAMGGRNDGHRDILGISLDAAETEPFWKEFLRSLVERGLSGVKLVISDAHHGLKNTSQQVLGEASWQSASFETSCCVFPSQLSPK